MLVVREMMLGPRRFGDLRDDLPGLSANVLTQRLEGLEASGLVRRRRLPPPASVQVYELTEWGLQAETVICELGRWAARSPGHDPTLPLSPVSLMLSFRAMFDPARAGGAGMAAGFVFGEDRFLAELVDGVLTTRRSDDPATAPVVVHGRPEPVAALVYGGLALSALEAEHALTVTGDRLMLERFAACFVLPPKAEIRG